MAGSHLRNTPIAGKSYTTSVDAILRCLCSSMPICGKR